jgi:catechol 2,3-dioxygenase-like lactoylglutathione lyase family enzyme
VRTTEITFTTADGPRAAAFWCAALDYRLLYRRDRYHVLGPAEGAHGPQVVIQAVDGHRPVSGSVHVDLRVDDPDGTVRLLLEHGARVEEHVGDEARAWTVMRDPDGNAFCVCPARPTAGSP